jgi:hypothetical protein
MSNFDLTKKVFKKGYFMKNLIQVLFYSYPGPILSYPGPICLIQVLFFMRFFSDFSHFHQISSTFSIFAYAVSPFYHNYDDTVNDKDIKICFSKKIIVFLRIFYFQDSFLNIRIGHFSNVQF